MSKLDQEMDKFEDALLKACWEKSIHDDLKTIEDRGLRKDFELFIDMELQKRQQQGESKTSELLFNDFLNDKAALEKKISQLISEFRKKHNVLVTDISLYVCRGGIPYTIKTELEINP